MEFDNSNGFLTEKGDKLFDTSNRSLKYGDGVFETMRLFKGKIMFWDDHYARLQRGIKYLKIEDSGKEKAYWEKEIERLVVKNKYFEARIKLLVFRDSPGLYTPMGNRLGFLIEGLSYDNSEYSFDAKGLKAGLFEADYKAISPLSNHKTTSALLFVLASIEKKQRALDEVIILNTARRVCEGTASNLFLRIGNDIFTPSLEEGCLDGVMRRQIINFFANKNNSISEGEITLETLEKADEIFLTNTISGVQSVRDFNGRSLNNDTSIELQNYLKYLVSQITPKNFF
jgi:branched-chain amino acid aminotransferase